MLGVYNTSVSANSSTAFDDDDRLLVLGNGSSSSNRSDALVINKDGKAYFYGEATGIDEFAFTINSTVNDNVSRNNGLKIIAGHGSYNSNNKSGFLEFEAPDGDYCGRIRQDGNASISLQSSSDRRLKENIRPTDYGLTDILKVEVRDYNYKTDPATSQHTGFIAQQLHTVFPMLVEEGGENPKKNPWTVNYSGMTPLLVKGIQDQQKIIEQLKVDNEELTRTMEDLKAQVQEIQDLKQQNAEMKTMLEQIQSRLLSAQLNNQQ